MGFKKMLQLIIFMVFLLFIISRHIKSYFSRPKFVYLKQSMYDYDFQTGDLVLCHRTPIFNGFTTSHFQHTGIVYKQPTTGQLFLWHMCAPLIICFATGNNRKGGLRIDPLYRALSQWRHCAVRKLMYVGTDPPDYQAKLSEEWMKAAMQNTNFNPKIFFNALARRLSLFLQPPDVIKKDDQSCAEVTTATYVQMGVLKPRNLRTNILPEDYWENNDKILLFQGGFYLDTAIPLM